MIEINGENAGYFEGLRVQANGGVIRGLVINRFEYGAIKLEFGDNHVIQCNLVGTDVTGTNPLGSFGYAVGAFESNYSIIGTDGDGIADDTERNLISDYDTGVWIAGSDYNRVSGNLIGTDVTGTLALGNTSAGVYVTSDANYNFIGTNSDGISDELEGNIISGNRTGVTLNASNNQVAGNYIGTDITGTQPLEQSELRIWVVSSTNNTIGGPSHDAANVIAFNGSDGISIELSSYNNRLSWNHIYQMVIQD